MVPVYFVWCLPIIIAAILIASARTSSANAGLCGLIASILVAFASAPNDFGLRQAMLASAQGVWLGALVGAVILGGLFFHELVSGAAAEDQSAPIPCAERRKELYAACFVLGPFAEAATGFGVGQITVAPILKRIGLNQIDAVRLGLFSQIMVPWGAFANGTIVGAQLSGVSPAALGVHSALLTAPLLLGWLCVFWHFASRAGIAGTPWTLPREIASTVALAGLLILANFAAGPEAAAMIALGPFIGVRFLLGAGADRRRWGTAVRVGLPYAALIGGIAGTRAIWPVNQWLAHAISIHPFAGGATWFPLLHPASWLIAGGVVSALLTRRSESILGALSCAWTLGRGPIFSIVLFLAMAQIMLISGMANGLAQALRLLLGPVAALATPLFAGLFGFLTSSSSTANGLLMPAQADLAQGANMSLPWLAALQNVAAAASTMLCPVRVAVGCSLAGSANLKRQIYARIWPLGVVPLSILLAAAMILVYSSAHRLRTFAAIMRGPGFCLLVPKSCFDWVQVWPEVMVCG